MTQSSTTRTAPPYTILSTKPTAAGGANIKVRMRGGRKFVVSVPVMQNTPEGRAQAIVAAAAAHHVIVPKGL